MMRRMLVTVAMLCLLTACSRETGLMWGQALTNAGNEMLSAPRVYCTTTRIGTTSYTSCR